MGLVASGRDAYRVVVHHGVGEQLVEPVCVAELGIAQVGCFGIGCVGQCKLPRNWVVFAQHLVHLAIYARVGSVGRLGIFQPALLLHVLVHVHLLLRVHQVKLSVRWYQAHGIFAHVVDVCLSGLSSFCSNDDDAGHGARTVDGGGRTVFQYLETLNVVRVKSGDGR